MNDIENGFADQILLGIRTHHLERGWVNEKDLFISGQDDRFWRPLHQSTVSSLALLESHLRLLAFGNIGNYSAVAGKFVLLVPHLKTTDANPTGFAARPQDAIFDVDTWHIA